MITKRRLAFTAIHVDTGLTFQVFCVDLFCEQFLAFRDNSGVPEFIFEERYYETETKQRVVKSKEERIWIVITETSNQYVREIKT